MSRQDRRGLPICRASFQLLSEVASKLFHDSRNDITAVILSPQAKDLGAPKPAHHATEMLQLAVRSSA
jgi:hypothetical protein